MIIGIVSGYFNPLHLGHLEYIEAAKKQCDHLIVIVNNDLQVELKGSKKFMDEVHRYKIMFSLKNVDDVMVSIDTDKTVCGTINFIRTSFPEHDMYFFNSGDRIGENNIESSEVILCKKLGIKYVAIDLPKKYYSSQLLKSI